MVINLEGSATKVMLVDTKKFSYFINFEVICTTPSKTHLHQFCEELMCVNLQEKEKGHIYGMPSIFLLQPRICYPFS